MAEKYKDVLSEIADRYGLDDDDVQALEDASPLRKRVADLNAEVESLRPAKAELEALKSAPKVTDAFREYGVDFDNLRPAERRMIENLKAPDQGPTAEWVAQHVQELELPVVERQPGEGTEQPAAAAFTQQATSPAGTRRAQTPTLTAADVAGWGIDDQQRFAAQHPDEWEVLKQGGTVTGVLPPAGVAASA